MYLCAGAWFNAAVRSRLVFTRDAIELRGHALTIGRGADCEFQIADERDSTRHCRLSRHDGLWSIQDLRSTNRTFVNDEPVGDAPRRLVHGDLVRLGAPVARLFEARFVLGEPTDHVAQASHAADDGLHRRIAELQSALIERNAEIVRVGAMYKSLQGQLGAHTAASGMVERSAAVMASELEGLREELEHARADHAGCRDAAERGQRRVAELEAQLDARDRKARRELDDAKLARKELESKLSVTVSELVLARQGLATATENIQTLKAAYDDVLARLDGLRSR